MYVLQLLYQKFWLSLPPHVLQGEDFNARINLLDECP